MSEPFVGEIRMFAGTFAPQGWAFCDGQLLAVAQNDALFSLLGTIYGGDGRTTFGLPDMRGRLPIHMGAGPGLSQRNIGSQGGLEQVALTKGELPAHTHSWSASSGAAQQSNPTGAALASPTANIYIQNAGTFSAMGSGAVTNTGGSQSHANVQPFLCVNFIISLFGIYPSRN